MPNIVNPFQYLESVFFFLATNTRARACSQRSSANGIFDHSIFFHSDIFSMREKKAAYKNYRNKNGINADMLNGCPRTVR